MLNDRQSPLTASKLTNIRSVHKGGPFRRASGWPDHYQQWTKEPAESRPTEQALADQGEVDEKASNEASARLLRLIICESCGILPDTPLLTLHSPSRKEK